MVDDTLIKLQCDLRLPGLTATLSRQTGKCLVEGFGHRSCRIRPFRIVRNGCKIGSAVAKGLDDWRLGQRRFLSAALAGGRLISVSASVPSRLKIATTIIPSRRPKA